MVTNGLLTIFTSIIIIASIFSMIGIDRISFSSMVSVFIFVLSTTTLFFAIIYRQGRQLRAEQEQQSTVFEHISDGILIINEDYEVVRFNPAAQRMLKISEDMNSLDFCTVCSNYPGVGKMCTYEDCFLMHHSNQSVEMQMKALDGKTSPMSVATSRFIGPDNKPWTVLSMHEVSRSRKDESNRMAKMITHSIMQAQENERKRISRELHDGIGQSLYSILIQLEVMQPLLADKEEASLHLDQVLHSIRSTIEDIRKLSVELRPSALDDMGLVAALRTYFSNYQKKFGVSVNFMFDGDKKRFPSTVDTALYRIVQEALTNTAKYAQTDRIDIVLSRTPVDIQLVIKDHGQGFEVEDPTRRGVGLYSMEERAAILGGTFRIVSFQNEGTTIEVKIPLQEGGETIGSYSSFVS
jgi:two-component system, NarL family, sensor histidine kinase NreB